MLHHKKKRTKKGEMTQEEINKSLTNPKSKNYVEPAILHKQVTDWQALVAEHNTKYEKEILSFMTEEQKKDKKSFKKYFDIALREAVKNKKIPPEPVMPDVIGIALLNICEGLGTHNNFRNYTYRDEMVRDAVLDCVKGAKKYNGKEYSNPFAYFSQIARWAFLGRLATEKKAHKTKMDLTFDPNLELYETVEDDKNDNYGVNNEDLRGFYYENK